ncbi:unnamed protein product [Lactuca saligna]|uniref:Transposase MuDR plant domain-containing protein n=1 Tax=Lactuca saligna TaxID=75948 RepID=A0AA35ZE77_LACSI|nr:unnamed protein product [Lactuca saligna]
MSFSTDGALSIDVFHNGVFVPKPLMYFNPDKTSVTEVDLRNMEFKDFIIYICNLTKGMCHDMYYCLPNRAIVDGLRELRDEDDYVRFLDAGYKNGRIISIYIDHDHEPLMQWIEEEIAEDGVYGDSDPCSDDVDSVMSDDISVDHEVHDEVIEIPKSVDPFLSKKNLIPEGGVDEEVDDEVHHFPIHDPDKKWDTMVPILGMRFSDRYELKKMLTNYAVFKGYALWYEKNDSTRLLVRCCKNKEGKATCPFRLWATPMSREDSFQIKSLIDKHNCCRQVNLGSIVTYRQCRNAKSFSLDEISGSLVGHYEKLWDYGAELLRSNPGSTVSIEVNPMPDSTVYFKRMYVCLKGVKYGWIEGCRRVICFLKGICRGELLAAVGRDSNNQVYPLAWVVVSVENKETWKWFLDLLL